MTTTLVLDYYGVDREEVEMLIPRRIYRSRDWLAHTTIVDGDLDFFDGIYKEYYSGKRQPQFLFDRGDCRSP